MRVKISETPKANSIVKKKQIFKKKTRKKSAKITNNFARVSNSPHTQSNFPRETRKHRNLQQIGNKQWNEKSIQEI